MPNARAGRSYLLAVSGLVLMSSVMPRSAAARAGGPDFEAAARAHLALGPLAGVEAGDLVPERTWTLSQGALVRFSQRRTGLRVLGSGISVRVDASGEVAYVVAEGSVRVASSVSNVPTLDDASAIARANALLHDGPREGIAELAFVASEGEPRLVYEVTLASSPGVSGVVAHVCAHTGRVLGMRETTISLDGAMVFPENPAKTPTLVAATLPVDALATSLVGEVTTLSCVDPGVCRYFDWLQSNAYFCLPTALAMRDGSGDFPYARPASDADPADAFAEVQAFFHVGKMLERFRTISGNPSLTLLEATQVQTNMVVPDWDPDNDCGTQTEPPEAALLVPFDNAYYTPADPVTGDPRTLGFGQGETIDFAYDGDVVYHEVAHAMQAEVAAIGAYYLPDEFGLRGDQGSLSEGNADFWSSVVTGDPEVGEYAGGGLDSQLPSGALRSLANDAHCPSTFLGEAHQDGLVWGGALWDIRTQTAEANRTALYEALFTVFATTTATSTLASMATAVENELALVFGEPARASAHAIFVERGIGSAACEARIVEVSSTNDQGAMFLPPSGYGDGQSPTVTQFAFMLEKKTKNVGVIVDRVFLGARYLAYSQPTAKLLVKCGGEPIRWTHGDVPTHDADYEAPFVFVGSFEAGTASASAIVNERFKPGVCHFQIVNLHPQLFVFARAHIAVDGSGLPPAPSDGCGCRVGASDAERRTMPLVVFALVCLARGFRRLRRRGTR